MSVATMPACPRAEQSAVRELVGRVAVEQCRRSFGEDLRAVVLTGSMARDEATILADPHGSRLLGDADFLLVFHERAALPNAEVIAALSDACTAAMASEGLAAHDGFAAVHEDYLRNLPADGFSYELRECGRVVWGDAQVLRLVPAFNDIEVEDGWRTLSNRMVEWLESAEEIAEVPLTCSEALHYRTVKLYLDMATSLLIFLDAYAPTYAERARRLEEIAQRPGADVSFSLPAFSRRVSECTAWKLGAPGAKRDLRPEFWREAAAYAGSLWRWEIARMTGASAAMPEDAVFDALANRQSAIAKLRGWLYVVRAEGWLHSWRCWRRWLSMARRATPRFYIYRAGYDLIAQLSKKCEGLKIDLPTGPCASWRDCARAVVDDYNRFVRETRA